MKKNRKRNRESFWNKRVEVNVNVSDTKKLHIAGMCFLLAFTVFMTTFVYQTPIEERSPMITGYAVATSYDSCENRCGDFTDNGCQCDIYCQEYGDCCSDYVWQCR